MDPITEVKSLLETATTETQFRTVASRAYFATYNHLIELVVQRGFVPNKSAHDHRRLAEFLTCQKNDLLQRVGKHRLRRLRKFRNHADYQHDIPFTKGIAVEAVAEAELIIVTWLPKTSSVLNTPTPLSTSQPALSAEASTPALETKEPPGKSG